MASASIIIPASNEGLVIEECLSSIASQIGCTGLDVIVVANGCSDETAALARAFKSKLFSEVIHLEL